MSDEPEDIRTQQVQHIQSLFAFDLFKKNNFDESLQLFLKLNSGNISLSVHFIILRIIQLIISIFFFIFNYWCKCQIAETNDLCI